MPWTARDPGNPTPSKVQTVKTAIEAASLILRVDDIVSGIKGQK